MTQPVDKLFAGIHSAALQEARALQQVAFEEACIRKILRQVGVAFHPRQASADCLARFGTPRLTFAWFEDVYTGFPVKLAAAKLPYTSGHHIGWTELFGKGFVELPWCREYVQQAGACGYDLTQQRLAMVFNAPHADKASHMVIHNHPVDLIEQAAGEERNTRLVRACGQPKIVFVVESFADFLLTVGTAWAAPLLD